MTTDADPWTDVPVQRAVVTGGSGFIGAHLIRDLLARGAEVVSIDMADPPPDLRDRVHHVAWNIRHPLGDVPEAAVGADLIAHFAARAREPGFPDHEYHDVNVTGTEHVLVLADKLGCSRLWFASSMSVYGWGDPPMTEASPLQPRTVYGRSKVDAEAVVERWVAEQSGRRAVVVRPAVVFGPGEHGNFSRLARALSRRLFVYPGRSDTIKASVHVDEAIRAVRFLESVSAAGGSPILVANIAYPAVTTIREICETFHRIAGYPRPRGTVPRPLLVAAAHVAGRLRPGGDVAPLRIDKLTNSTNVQPARLVELGYPFSTDLESGLRRWYESEPRGQFV